MRKTPIRYRIKISWGACMFFGVFCSEFMYGCCLGAIIHRNAITLSKAKYMKLQIKVFVYYYGNLRRKVG